MQNKTYPTMTNVTKSKVKSLTVVYTAKAQKNVLRKQEEHMKATGKFISVKAVASKILENAL